ncbi:MAG TPA: DUF3999 family protein [Pirellulales bacterium]|nr:DUF3999 family protein [Pirellulales bacterium]
MQFVLRVLLITMVFAAARRACAADGDATQAWEFYAEISLPETDAAAKWLDVIVSPAVFNNSRFDLGDLRLYDSAGSEIPYALRVREAQSADQGMTVRSFDRAEGPDSSSEVSLDLGENPQEHNAVEIELPGSDYRRAAELEASDDGKTWRRLAKKNLIDFRSGNDKLVDRRIGYPPSRYRYLRLRVYRDPLVDKAPVEIGGATVYRQVTLLGEYVRYPAEIGPGEPVRSNGQPGSAWIFDLGYDLLPVSKLLVDVGNAEFARDYTLAASDRAAEQATWNYATSGQWSRTAGDARKPMEATFTESRCGRLKLTVTDYRNRPIQLENVTAVGAARQIVFANNGSLQGPLRLYYGNPAAELPHYDLERNLPARLDPEPTRLSLGTQQTNPSFVPSPLTLAERWPGAIYAVLGSMIAVLAGLIATLGRAVIREVDRAEPAPSKGRTT